MTTNITTGWQPIYVQMHGTNDGFAKRKLIGYNCIFCKNFSKLNSKYCPECGKRMK